MALKALYPISLQKETGVPHVARQSADANETRLNENFKRITEQLAELYAGAGGGSAGAPGATFTPHVSEDGVLSWTNDAGLPNPDPINIGGGSLLPATVDMLGGIKVGNNLTIDADGVLSVDTATAVEADNTRPVTSAAVDTTVGNIAVLLATI